jgi:hypothetical protein
MSALLVQRRPLLFVHVMCEIDFRPVLALALQLVLLIGGVVMMVRSRRELRLSGRRKNIQSFTVGSVLFVVGAGVLAAWLVVAGTPTPWLNVVSLSAQLLLIAGMVCANVWIRRQHAPQPAPGNVIAP